MAYVTRNCPLPGSPRKALLTPLAPPTSCTSDCGTAGSLWWLIVLLPSDPNRLVARYRCTQCGSPFTPQRNLMARVWKATERPGAGTQGQAVPSRYRRVGFSPLETKIRRSCSALESGSQFVGAPALGRADAMSQLPSNGKSVTSGRDDRDVLDRNSTGQNSSEPREQVLVVCFPALPEKSYLYGMWRQED